jgi:hypothetical protein
LIEAGWDAETVREFSVAKLNWVMDQRRTRELKAEIRNLFTHAAASQGGEGFKMRFGQLQRELQTLCKSTENAEPVSQTPKSQAEFEAMLAEQ